MRHLTTFLFVLFLQIALAQAQPFQAGVLPEVAISYQWTEKLQQTIKIESMHELFHTETQVWDYTYDRTDVQAFLEGRLNPFIKIAGGYQYRLEGGGGDSHRLIQQAAFLQKRTGFRLGHRLRTDQTIEPSETVKWRLRYRLSAEIPLEGQSLDAGEFYLLMSGEPIYSMQAGVSGLETRLAASVGYYIDSAHKLEMGLDYRLEEILENPVRQKLWLKVGWYYLI